MPLCSNQMLSDKIIVNLHQKFQHCRIKPRSTSDDDSSSEEETSNSDSSSDDGEYNEERDSYRVCLTEDVDLDIPRRGRMRSSGVYRATLGHKVRILGSICPINLSEILKPRNKIRCIFGYDDCMYDTMSNQFLSPFHDLCHPDR